MKIGIFGDSYAKTLDHHPDSRFMGKAWWEILAENHEVTNHGLGGSAAYYSIEQFDEYQSEYDRIVFCMTFPGRVYLGKNKGIKNPYYPKETAKNFNGYDSAKNALEFLKEFPGQVVEDNITIKAVMDYFLYVQNIEEETFKIRLYSDYVKKIRPDSLILHAADLANISNSELMHWGLTHAIFSEYAEIRKCHFSDENNIIFAGRIEKWLKTNTVNLDPSTFAKPKDPWERYFKKYDL